MIYGILIILGFIAGYNLAHTRIDRTYRNLKQVESNLERVLKKAQSEETKRIHHSLDKNTYYENK